jgi:hypothetical protein
MLSRHQLRMVVAILTGHTPVRTQLRTMGLFEDDPICRFCRQEAETVQHIICHCEATVRRQVNVFGDSVVEPKVIRAASQGPLPLHQRHKAAEFILKR